MNINEIHDKINQIQRDIDNGRNDINKYNNLKNTINSYIKPRLNDAMNQLVEARTELEKNYVSEGANEHIKTLGREKSNLEQLIRRIDSFILPYIDEHIRVININISNCNDSIENLKQGLRQGASSL